MRWLLFLTFLGACRVGEDQDEENPPEPQCTRADPGGGGTGGAEPEGNPVCPAGYEVTCLDPDHPEAVCFFDPGELEGEARCWGLETFPPYPNPECIHDD